MIPRKKLVSIESKIIENCKSCGGKGCRSCKHKRARALRYAAAEIPLHFWNLAIKDFPGDMLFKKAISEKAENIDELYENGTSLAFVGNYGTGKSSMACALLKIALTKGYSGHYANMSDIIDQVSKGNYDYTNKLMEVEFLCIDEFDSRWVYPSEKAEQLFGQTMERILRKRFQNQLVTIICSNTPKLETVLANEFSNSIRSLFSQYLEIYYVAGKDQRRALQK